MIPSWKKEERDKQHQDAGWLPPSSLRQSDLSPLFFLPQLRTLSDGEWMGQRHCCCCCDTVVYFLLIYLLFSNGFFFFFFFYVWMLRKKKKRRVTQYWTGLDGVIVHLLSLLLCKVESEVRTVISVVFLFFFCCYLLHIRTRVRKGDER
jgi:hypothetical protein